MANIITTVSKNKTNRPQLAVMSSGAYKIDDQYAVYYLTIQVINWIDVFTRRRYRDIIIDSLKFCQKEKELKVHGYVIMSNHIHIILSSVNGQLSNTIRDFKSFTSKAIIRSIQTEPESRRDWMLGQMQYYAKRHRRNRKFQLWTHENHAVSLESNKFIDQKLDYIHYNPVEAGIVDEPENYIYSSARNYSGITGLLEIEYLD